jgi:hypothetical protein
VLTAGVLRIRSNIVSGGNLVAQPGHKTIIDGTVGGAPQILSGAVQFGRLEIAGTRGFGTQGWGVTVLDSLTVATPVPFGFSSGTISVGGRLGAAAASTLTFGTLVLGDTSSLDHVLGTATIGTLQYAGDPVPLYTLPTDSRFTIGNLVVDNGATVTVSGAQGTRLIGGGTAGTITVLGTLNIPDGVTLKACRTDNGGLAGGAPGVIAASGTGALELRLPGPRTSTTFGGGTTPGTFNGFIDGVNLRFGIATGC